MNKLSIILGKKRFLPLACLAISAGLLIAGLWPFQFRPVNNVHWIDGQAGLRFGRYGMVSGQSPLFTPGGPLDFAKPFTIRLELLPRDEPSDYLPRILSVYEAGGRELFILGQWKSALNLSILERQRAYYFEYQETEVGNLPKGAKRSILLSSGETGLTVYSEGKLVFTRPGFGFSLLPGNREPAWLLLGNSPSGESPWRGDLLSLSFYADAISPEEIATPGIDPLVRFLFSEGSGTVCRGGSDPRYDLFISPVFRAPVKPVLAPPWKVQEYDLSFWVDVAVNILGFIPFGFTGPPAARGWRAKTYAGHGPRGPGGCGDQPPDRTAAGVPPDPRLLAHGFHEQHAGGIPRRTAFPGLVQERFEELGRLTSRRSTSNVTDRSIFGHAWYMGSLWSGTHAGRGMILASFVAERSASRRKTLESSRRMAFSQ
jgi:hypothetical protein